MMGVFEATSRNRASGLKKAKRGRLCLIGVLRLKWENKNLAGASLCQCFSYQFPYQSFLNQAYLRIERASTWKKWGHGNSLARPKWERSSLDNEEGPSSLKVPGLAKRRGVFS